MKRIRIGKDISMRWEITTDGVAIPLDGRDLTVEIKSPAGIENNIPYRIDGNILIMTYYGYEQKRTGEYSITLWEKKGKLGQNVVDVIRAFELVRTSQEENDFVGGDLQIESVDLGTGNFDILTEGGYRAINIDTLQAEALEDSVNIKGKTYSNESFTITLPKANLDSAGVMSADDKHTLQEHGNRIAQINTTLDEHTESINARITTDRIADGAVTSEKIATSAFDSTLSVSGKIAPADVVGTRLTELFSNIITTTQDYISYATEAKYFNLKTNMWAKSDTIRTAIIPIQAGVITKSNTLLVNDTIGCVLLADDKKTFVKNITLQQINDGYTISNDDYTNGARYIVISYRASGDSKQDGVYMLISHTLQAEVDTILARLIVDENKITEVENYATTKEIVDITSDFPIDNTGYRTTVGSQPTLETIPDKYTVSGLILDVSKGDIVKIYNSISYGSWAVYAKVKDGVITSIAAYTPTVKNYEVECDGSFDQLVVNLCGTNAGKKVERIVKVGLDKDIEIVSTKLAEEEARAKASEEVLTNEVNRITNMITEDATEAVSFSDEHMAYRTVVGHAPVYESSTSYNYKGVLLDVQKGETYIAIGGGANSWRIYAKVKNGIITEVGDYEQSTAEIYCDGSFDQLIFNVLNTTGIVNKIIKVDSIEKIKHQLENLSLPQKPIRVLVIGNSFAQDSFAYVPFILNNVLKDVECNIQIGIYFIGSASLKDHWINYCRGEFGSCEETTSNTYVPSDGKATLYLYNDRTANKWSYSSVILSDVIGNYDWDIVALQQVSNETWLYDTFQPYYNRLAKVINAKSKNKAVKICFNMAHKMNGGNYSGTCAVAQQLLEDTMTEFVFPYGTAVENAMTTKLKDLAYAGSRMTGDGHHLQEGIPCQIAAYCVAQKILEIYQPQLSVFGDITRCDAAWAVGKAIPGPNGDYIGISDENCFIAQVCAIQAVKHPYTIKDCSAYDNVVDRT